MLAILSKTVFKRSDNLISVTSALEQKESMSRTIANVKRKIISKLRPHKYTMQIDDTTVSTSVSPSMKTRSDNSFSYNIVNSQKLLEI